MKNKIFIQRLTSIISIIFLFAAVVFCALTFFTDYDYKWFGIISLVLFIVLNLISIFIDTRTPKEIKEDEERAKKEQDYEKLMQEKQEERIKEANEKYNGDLCKTCIAGMSFCDTCSNYNQFK